MYRFPYAWLSWCIGIPLMMGLWWYATLHSSITSLNTIMPTVDILQSDTHISLGRGVVVWPHRILTAQHVVNTIGGYTVVYSGKNSSIDRVEFGSGDTARCYVDAPLTTVHIAIAPPQEDFATLWSLTGEIEKSDGKRFITIKTHPWDSGTPLRQSGNLIGVVSSYDPLLHRTLIALP